MGEWIAFSSEQIEVPLVFTNVRAHVHTPYLQSVAAELLPFPKYDYLLTKQYHCANRDEMFASFTIYACTKRATKHNFLSGMYGSCGVCFSKNALLNTNRMRSTGPPVLFPQLGLQWTILTVFCGFHGVLTKHSLYLARGYVRSSWRNYRSVLRNVTCQAQRCYRAPNSNGFCRFTIIVNIPCKLTCCPLKRGSMS